MGFNILDIANDITKAAAITPKEEYTEITLPREEIKVTRHNKYSMEDIDELATSLLMDGLQEPLIVGRVNGEYCLASGHRRFAAAGILADEGHEEFEKIPCRYKDMTETQFRIALLIGNTFNRKMTDFDMMIQAADWKEVLTQAKKEKLILLENGKRIRDYVAEILGESPTKIGQLEAINHNAGPAIKEQFEKGNIGITSAYEASKLEPEEQSQLAEAIESGEDVKSEEIKAIVSEKKNARKTKEEETREAAVSDTDTEEETKENAKKLHALKMLEKYYTWLNEEELNILTRICEDCKRRKREYALEED